MGDDGPARGLPGTGGFELPVQSAAGPVESTGWSWKASPAGWIDVDSARFFERQCWPQDTFELLLAESHEPFATS